MNKLDLNGKTTVRADRAEEDATRGVQSKDEGRMVGRRCLGLEQKKTRKRLEERSNIDLTY